MDLRSTPDRHPPHPAGGSRPEASTPGPTPARAAAVDERGSAAGRSDPSGARTHQRSPLGELWRQGQHGWPARYPIAQFPNAPLLVALAGSFTSSLTDGSTHAYARAVFYAALSAWAWEELSDGANSVRRALGVGALAYVVVELGTALAARG